MQINLNNIDYTYNKGTVFEKKVLKNVTLKLKERSYNVIVGKTGSGKSTLIEHINGLLVPNSGEVIVGDTIITFPRNKREKKELEYLKNTFSNFIIIFTYFFKTSFHYIKFQYFSQILTFKLALY